MSVQAQSGVAAAMCELRVLAAAISRVLRLWYPRFHELEHLVDILSQGKSQNTFVNERGSHLRRFGSYLCDKESFAPVQYPEFPPHGIELR